MTPLGCFLQACWAGQWAGPRVWFQKCQWWTEPSFVFLAPPAVSSHRLYRSARHLWLSHLCADAIEIKNGKEIAQ